MIGTHKTARVHWRRSVLALIGALGVGLIASPVFAEIKLGMSAALSGPTGKLGQGMKHGIEAYLQQVNDTGGVNGKRLALIALDDGYEPARAAPNMHKLIDDEQVVSVLGNVGTPTAIVTVPIANEEEILLFGAFTGSGVLRQDPPDRYVINYRASYAEETTVMVDNLLDQGVKPEEIAFFTQNDGYGDAGYQGAVAALKARGYADADSLPHGRYKRNTLNIEEGLAALLDSDVEPRAIIMVGAYAPCAKFIELAQEFLPDTYFLNVSFVGTDALAEALGPDGNNVIVTQVVPHYDGDTALVREYREALTAYDDGLAPGFVSLEGYAVAKLYVEGLRKAGSSIDRESVIDGLESLGEIDLGLGEPVRLSETEHQASHRIWPTVIRAGKVEPFDWSQL